MNVLLNGEPRELDDGASVRDVVVLSGAPQGRGVAVAIDGEVVPRAAWGERRLTDGQRVEVVQAVQGG